MDAVGLVAPPVVHHVHVEPLALAWREAVAAHAHVGVQRVGKPAVARPLEAQPRALGYGREGGGHRAREGVAHNVGFGFAHFNPLEGGVDAVAVVDDKDIEARLEDHGVGDGGVAHRGANPRVGAARRGAHAYLQRAAGAGLQGVELDMAGTEHQKVVARRVGGAAAVGHVGHQAYGVEARRGVGVLRVGEGGGGAVAKIP